MYLPVDPVRSPGIWRKLEESLCTQRMVFVVMNGVAKEDRQKKVLDAEECDHLIGRMKNCDYVKIGTSRALPIAPHFAVRIVDGVGYVQEYISQAERAEQMITDLRKLIQMAFYEVSGLAKLCIPVELEEFQLEGFAIRAEKNGVVAEPL